MVYVMYIVYIYIYIYIWYGIWHVYSIYRYGIYMAYIQIILLQLS